MNDYGSMMVKGYTKGGSVDVDIDVVRDAILVSCR